MKKILILSLIALPFLSQLAHADANNKAKELIKIMEATKQLDESQNQIIQIMDQMIVAQGLTGEEAEKAKAIAKKSMESSFVNMKSIDWEAMFGDIYASVFTEEEIQALIDFYKSPIGKKLLKQQPELMAATIQKMQSEMAKLMPKIQPDDEEYSLASGGAGVALSDGTFFYAKEALISQANPEGFIEEIYMPGEASAQLPNGNLRSTETELRQTDNGTLYMTADSMTFERKKRYSFE